MRVVDVLGIKDSLDTLVKPVEPIERPKRSGLERPDLLGQSITGYDRRGWATSTIASTGRKEWRI